MSKDEIHPLEPISKESLYTKVADSIYNYIRINELKPGERLPSERKMAAAFI